MTKDKHHTTASLAVDVPALYAQQALARWGVSITEHEARQIVARVRAHEEAAGRAPKVSAVARYLHDHYRYYGHFQFLADLEAGALAAV